MLVLVGLGVVIFIFKPFQPVTDPSRIIVSGTIEVTETQMSFRIPGHLAERLVEEGDRVKAGQLLARLDTRPQQIAVQQAEANLQLSRTLLAELEAGSRSQEIEAARAELDHARAGAESAAVQLLQTTTDYQRHAALVENGGVSRQMFEDYRTREQTARNRKKEADARVKMAAERLDLLIAGPRREQIDQARARVAVAESALDHAQLQLAYCTLSAPTDGIVLTSAAEPGEYLNPASPVVTVGDLDRPWLRAYLNEPFLGNVHLNQQVRVRTDSFPGKAYSGRISFISDQAEFTPKTVQTFEERVKLMYRIKIALANPDQELKPGMPADAEIDLAR